MPVLYRQRRNINKIVWDDEEISSLYLSGFLFSYDYDIGEYSNAYDLFRACKQSVFVLSGDTRR